MKFKLRTVLISLIVGLCLILTALFASMKRSFPVTVTFAGYTNDQTGQHTLAAFRLTNHTSQHFHCMQLTLEVKSAQGWIHDNDHTGYQHGILYPRTNMIITLLSPTTNGIWQANFEFQNMPRRSVWWVKMEAALARRNIYWKRDPKTYVVTTAEIEPR